MTTENQSTTTTSIEETPTYSKASSMGKTLVSSKSLDKTSTGMMTLSLRPTRSVKKNNSFKPSKKLR
ncbi:MAG: hypothetical protein H7281_12845 [Bacteriovorax sp.]|nr:hypothetical protein [Bacteriovorax sp.]